MARKYHTLVVRENGQWSPEFGDYDRSVVKDELDDYRDHDYKSKDLKIITTGETQADVMAAVAKLNEVQK